MPRDRNPSSSFFFFFQAEDGIRDDLVTGVQTCALPIYPKNKFSFIWLYNEQNRFFRRDTSYQFVTQDASWLQIEPAYILQGLWTSQITNNFLLDFRIGWNKIVFPLSYQHGSTGLNLQDIGTSTESGDAPYEFINPAWVLKWSAI